MIELDAQEFEVVCGECGTKLEAKKKYVGYHGEFNIRVWPCMECDAVDVARFAQAVASGDPLDKLGEMVGVERKPGESDAELRARTEMAKL